MNRKYIFEIEATYSAMIEIEDAENEEAAKLEAESHAADGYCIQNGDLINVTSELQ